MSRVAGHLAEHDQRLEAEALIEQRDHGLEIGRCGHASDHRLGLERATQQAQLAETPPLRSPPPFD